MITRPLQHDESPAVGDCFQLLAHAAYGTAIVTKVHPDLSIDCLRVYAQITGAVSSPALGFETLTNLSRESYRACKWYVTGSSGTIDNRWYEEQRRRAQEVETDDARIMWIAKDHE